jgi:GTP-binding protein
MITVALVGRPNVGKSSIFNCLAGKQLALVHDTPGVTRDWRIAEGSIGSYVFNVMDTAGLDDKATADDVILKQMQEKTRTAMQKADVLLFVLDGQAGLTETDRQMAKSMRKWNKPIIVVVNKADSKKSRSTSDEAYSLGFGAPVLISAAHNDGFLDLGDAIGQHIPEDIVLEEIADDKDDYGIGEIEEYAKLDEEEVVQDAIDPEKPIKIAIVGRPNVGKSTLLNAIIGEERSITSPIAGTTRDTVSVKWLFEGQHFRLVDTAGLRKKSKIIDRLEKMSASETDRAIRLAQAVILVLDATATLDHQDQAIAEHVIREGRALVIAFNKWDEVKNGDTLRHELREKLNIDISQVRDVPMVTLSALTGKGVPKLLQMVIDTYAIWGRRVATSPLNRWLARMESAHQPPMASGRSNRLRYITQIKSKPPTFAVWVSRPHDIPDSYARFLVNGLRDTFELPGVPIRLEFRKSKNPYTDRT